jgi:hypothetical protein
VLEKNVHNGPLARKVWLANTEPCRVNPDGRYALLEKDGHGTGGTAAGDLAASLLPLAMVFDPGAESETRSLTIVLVSGAIPVC